MVRLVLAEEGVEYRSRGTDIHAHPEQVSPWYVRINPNCNVPTLIHRGKPVVESKDIAIFVVDQGVNSIECQLNFLQDFNLRVGNPVVLKSC